MGKVGGRGAKNGARAVASSDEDIEGWASPPPALRPQQQSRPQVTLQWVDKYGPKDTDQLAVHKAKVQELRAWLLQALTTQGRAHGAVLTGPPGAGKTAALRCVAAELGLDLGEWVNPPQATWASMQQLWDMPGGRETMGYVPALAGFEDYLHRAGRYAPMGQANGRVLLVEDLPNLDANSPLLQTFQGAVANYLRGMGCPLVFVVSQSHTQATDIRRLFGPSLLDTGLLHEIKFNAVAATNMRRVLSAVGQAEGLSLGRSDLDQLVAAANGDIRNALLALQFAAAGDGPRQAAKPPKKKPRTAKASQHSPPQEKRVLGVAGRETSLFIFHALGKVLHCKRLEHEAWCDGVRKDLVRSPLAFDPEDVLERAHVSSERFVLLLAENYLPFMDTLDHACMAADALADADLLAPRWDRGQGGLETTAGLVAVRGVAFANVRHSKGGGEGRHRWQSLMRARWPDVRLRTLALGEDLRRAVALRQGTMQQAEVLLRPDEAFVLTLPCMAAMGQGPRSDGLGMLLRSLGHYRADRRGQVLGETDAPGDDDTQQQQQVQPAATVGLVQGQRQGPAWLEDDDIEDV